MNIEVRGRHLRSGGSMDNALDNKARKGSD